MHERIATPLIRTVHAPHLCEPTTEPRPAQIHGVMKTEEILAENYLKSLQLGGVAYEPDGKVPPDFRVGQRIAVEVTRLSKGYEQGSERRTLEEDTIPLHQGFDNLLAEFVGNERAWFVYFSCHRPLASWRQLRPRVRRVLRAWLDNPVEAALHTIPLDVAFRSLRGGQAIAREERAALTAELAALIDPRSVEAG